MKQKNPSRSRARAREEAPELIPPEPPGPEPTAGQLKRQRIFEIAKRMAEGSYQTRKTVRELAAEWGLSRSTVDEYAAEASRLLDYTTGERRELVRLARVRLLEIGTQDEADRVQAWRTLLEHLGELRQNHVIKAGHDPFEGWTDEEIEAYAATGKRPERLSRAGQ